MNTTPIEPILETASGATGATGETQACGQWRRAQIWSWAVRETAFWLAQKPNRDQAIAKFMLLNATDPSVYLLHIQNGEVTIADKPATLADLKQSDRHRASLYRDYIQMVVARFCPHLTTQLVIDTADARRRNDDIPIFVFQKPPQCNEILLPDVDFFHHNFYDTDDAYKDRMPFSDKGCHAIFVGSTTGGPLTENLSTVLSLPRVRSALHFRRSRDISFLLPNIVQCDSPAAEEFLRGLGFGGGERVSWPEQLREKFIISMDGNGATCSRVIIALRSNSVLLKYDSPHSLYYFSGLCPWTHYIPIRDDTEIQRIVDAERRHPGLFSHVAHAGREFAEAYLTRQGTMLYTAWLLELYERCFRDQGADPTCSGSYGSVTEGRVPAWQSTPPRLEVLAHVQDTGDKRSDLSGWVGVPGSGKWIEGLSVDGGCDIVPSDIECTAVLRGGATLVVGGGGFAGTRGQATPLIGFRLSLGGEAVARYVGSYEATFVDGSVTGPLAFGDLCVAEGNAPLEALRVSLQCFVEISKAATSGPRT